MAARLASIFLVGMCSLVQRRAPQVECECSAQPCGSCVCPALASDCRHDHLGCQARQPRQRDGAGVVARLSARPSDDPGAAAARTRRPDPAGRRRRPLVAGLPYPRRASARSSSPRPVGRFEPARGGRAPTGCSTACRTCSGYATGLRTSSPTTAGWRTRRGVTPGLRMPRTALVMESLVPAILEQLVTGTEAKASWRQLVTRFGEAAARARTARVDRDAGARPAWVNLPDWEWHRAGVDGRRRQTLIAAARVAPALERTVELTAGRGQAGRCARSPASASGPLPRCRAARTATPTPSRSATTTSPRRSAGRCSAGRSTTRRCSSCSSPTGRSGSGRSRLILMAGPGKPRFAPRYSPRDNRAI